MKVYGWMCISNSGNGLVEVKFFRTQHAASEHATGDGYAGHVHILPFILSVDNDGNIVE